MQKSVLICSKQLIHKRYFPAGNEAMTEKRLSNVAGFDDAPFERNSKGDVKIVGTVYAGLRFDGVLIGSVEKDGFDAASRLIELVGNSKFAQHIQMIMLQGIAFAGFNVIDVFEIHKQLNIPVLVVARRLPDMDAIYKALFAGHIPRETAKRELINRLGPMEPVKNIFVQRLGLSVKQAAKVVEKFTIYGNIPEPLRTAHLIAGALSNNQSRKRA